MGDDKFSFMRIALGTNSVVASQMSFDDVKFKNFNEFFRIGYFRLDLEY